MTMSGATSGLSMLPGIIGILLLIVLPNFMRWPAAAGISAGAAVIVYVIVEMTAVKPCGDRLLDRASEDKPDADSIEDEDKLA